jgi:hypothetical protein
MRLFRTILTVFTGLFALMQTLSGQSSLQTPMLADSLITQFNIRMVTQDAFNAGMGSLPYSSKTELYDVSGRVRQRINTHFKFYRSVETLKYNDKKKRITVYTLRYDWRPKSGGQAADTTIKHEKEQYQANGSSVRQSKYSRNLAKASRSAFDSLGRLMLKTDSVKCGNVYSRYCYDQKGRLCSITRSRSYHHHPAVIFGIDSFEYDISNRISKTIKCSSFSSAPLTHHYEIISVYTYNDTGLPTEMRVYTRFKNPDKDPELSIVYKYRYNYY